MAKQNRVTRGDARTTAAASEAPTPESYIRELDALWRRCDRAYHDAAMRCGVSDSVGDVMYAIATLGEGCTQRDICEIAFVSKQTVNSAVKRLLVDGALRQEAGTGRSVRLYLTDSGRALSARCASPVIEAEKRTMREIDSEDLEAFVRIGRAFVASLCENLDNAIGKAPTQAGDAVQTTAQHDSPAADANKRADA